MNTLHVTKLRFTLAFTRPARLSPFIGNTIRGALGSALFDHAREVYDAVFKVAGVESAPNPFAITAPFPGKGAYAVGEMLEFYVTLFGSACGCGEEIAAAAQLMCKGKLSKATLTEVVCVYDREWSDAGAETIPYCNAITLNFITPTEILSSKQPVYEPDFSTFIDSLFGRISAIIDNYGDKEFTVPYALITKKPKTSAEYDLEHLQINTSKHPINGFVGKITYSGDVTRYLPYIDLGSQLHLGKKTTRSCGEYVYTLESNAP